MAGLFAVDGGVDVDDAVVTLGKTGDFDSGAVGDLALQVPQQLLADDLSHDLALGLVGGQVLVEQEGGLDGVLLTLLEQVLHTVAGLGGDGDDGIKLGGLGVDSDDFQQLVLLHGVDLVDGQDGGAAGALDLLDQTLFLGTDGGDGLDNQNGGVHISDGLTDGVDHVVAQLGAGAVVAGGVDKDELGIAAGDDAADAVTGGLGLVGNDGDLLADQIVGQGGLTDVGTAGNGNHSGFGIHKYFSY